MDSTLFGEVDLVVSAEPLDVEGVEVSGGGQATVIVAD